MRKVGIALMAATLAAAGAAAAAEDYADVPKPAGFSVQSTELEGSVFANAQGKTLYIWPFQRMRNGLTGDAKGKTNCGDKVLTETAGLASPWPPGLLLPDLDTRPACVDMWIPELAPADAKPVGDWSLITRPDGNKQWAYNEQAVYTSNFDKQPGDVNGDRSRARGNDSPAARLPVGPPPNVPPGFSVRVVATGVLVTTIEGYSLYVSDRDTASKSNCNGLCEETWQPMIAPELASPLGDWTMLERANGVKQWVFRGKPVYRHALDSYKGSLEGGDTPGWQNVYMRKGPPPPPGFTIQEASIGLVLADGNGRTIYTYNCGDDSYDQLRCDHPDGTQAYRIAMCGGGSQEQCLKTWPMVSAQPNDKSGSRTWSVVAIDPKTGKYAAPGQADAMHVWAFRGRPVYTFVDDKKPGDTEGDSFGEWRGTRNGFTAFFLRDDFLDNAN